MQALLVLIRCLIKRRAGFLLVLVTLVSSRSTWALDGQSILAGNLALTNDSTWRYFVGDIVEGGYLGWLRPGTEQIQATIPLATNLPAGTYSAFVKAAIYDAPNGVLTFTLGTVSGTLIATNGDWNGYWAGPTTLTTSSPVDSIVVRFQRTAPRDVSQRIVIGGVYITTNLSENFVAGQTDRIAAQTPTIVPPSPAPTLSVNLVPNPSFEVGLGHGWGFQASGYDRESSFASFVSTAHAQHGSRSFHFKTPGILVSRAIQLRRSGRYTLSFWARSDGNIPVIASLVSAWGPAPGTTINGVSQTFFAPTTWRRFTLTTNLYLQPGPDHHVRFDVRSTNVWIDSIQLQEDAPTDFATAQPFDIGLSTTMPANLFTTEETPLISVSAISYTNSITNRVIAFSVYDTFGNRVYSTNLSFDGQAGSLISQNVILPEIGTGAFRAIALDQFNGRSFEEIAFAIIPPGSQTSPESGSRFGIHQNLSSFQIDLNRKLGIHDLRVLSPAAIFRWTIVEPTEGQFVWFDAELDRALSRGNRILGTLVGGASNLPWPRWADKSGLPDLQKWYNYVERVVTHYRGRVHYWEVWNEPIHTFSTEFYAELLRGTAAIIRRVDPDSKIVGMGGVYSKEWIRDVLMLLGPNYRDHLDLVSTHLYPPKTDPSGGDTETRARLFKTDIVDTFGLEVWNTETGVWDEGFYRGPNSGFSLIGESVWPFRDSERFQRGSHYEATRLLANLFHCIGNGLNTYYYYDSRFFARPDYRATHCSYLEFDDTIRPKGIAYAIAASQLSGFVGHGNISPHTNAIVYLFSKGSNSCAVAWTRNETPMEITFESSGVRVLNFMGNQEPLSNGRARIGWIPKYLIATGIDLSNLRNRLTTGTYATSLDSTAPSVTIDDVSVFPGDGATVSMRWMAIDDTSIPASDAPDALTYSYIVDGPSSKAASNGWTPDMRTSIKIDRSGDYILRVRAKDSSGNIGPEASWHFSVRPYEIIPKRPRTPEGLRPL